MKKLKEHINRLHELLENIETEFETYSDINSLSERKVQLKSIEQSIQNLSKNNISIPQELRELKLRLISEVEAWKEAQKLKNETIEKLSAFLAKFNGEEKTSKKQKKERNVIVVPVKKDNSQRVELIDIFKSGIITPDMQLFKNYNNQTYTGKITQNGAIQVIVNGVEVNYKSPSQAATEVSGKNQNGWTWWNTLLNRKKRNLDYFRKKFIRNQIKQLRTKL